MATVTFSAAGRPNTNPFLDSSVTGFTSVGAAGALISSQTWLGANSSANTLYDSNVIQNTAGIAGDAGSYVSVRAECTGTSGVVDAAGKLTGTYKTNYLGSRGCELNSLVA